LPEFVPLESRSLAQSADALGKLADPRQPEPPYVNLDVLRREFAVLTSGREVASRR
jgi:hypothetical protein